MSCAAPWIVPDWADKEPNFPPGSLFWMTNEFQRCPVLYRTVLQVEKKPLAFAGFRARASQFAYIFLNGRQIAHCLQKGEAAATEAFDVELTHLLKPGNNVLVVSTTSDGFSLEGGVGYQDGTLQRFGSDTHRWKVQKFPPLTMLEYECCMQPEFDDANWFPVKDLRQKPIEVDAAQLKELCRRLEVARLKRLDEEARWRLQMLSQKGIAIVDGEAYGWAGAARLPGWVCAAAQPLSSQEPKPGWYYSLAEALTRYVHLSDETTNLENYVIGLKVLQAPAEEIAACQSAAQTLRTSLKEMEQAIKDEKYDRALTAATRGEAIVAQARKVRVINDLCWCLDNKFGWFDTNLLLDNDIANWGLGISSPVTIFASPLSPAALITVHGQELVIKGWDKIQPLRVYEKPPQTGPVCLWVVLNGKVTNLKPPENGIVYERSVNGKFSENWGLLVNDLSRGGHLPVELVFMQNPVKIVFKTGERGTSEVIVTFDKPGTQLFILRPLKEWRGFLAQARLLTQEPLNEAEAQQYIKQCRFWSRALLNYPITFSEVFVRDPQDKWALIVADVYNYWELKDEWGTKPLRSAPLPPLATYGLMIDYPGLKVISKAQVLGSRGVWGDEIAALGQNYIVYRVPLDPIKRFGGFTSFCFGETDIGEPGSLKEIETIKRTGANSFRPQHNQTGERAMKTLRWSWEQGIQNVFNIDEKWVLDVCEHFRRLAEQCKDYPPDAVAYDLLNEPETRDPRAYNALIKKVTKAIREIDKTHLIYVEVIPPWGPGASPYPHAAFESLQPTGDPQTCYSFHDYEFRLPPRWPNEEHDLRDILARWIPAFKFSIDHRAPIHLGEFGGFEQTKESVYDNSCAFTLMMDYFKIFDQFGWHFHYYANRGLVRLREDGSLQESYVQEAYRRYFAKGTFNVNRQP